MQTIKKLQILVNTPEKGLEDYYSQCLFVKGQIHESDNSLYFSGNSVVEGSILEAILSQQNSYDLGSNI